MSKVVGFIVGATLVAIGIVTGNVGLIIEGAALIVTQAVADLTMPKTPAREASEMSIALGEQPRVALFGETMTPGSLVDGFNYGGTYGTDWEVLVIRLADHKCEGLTGFYVNDLFVAYTGDGLYPAFNTDHLAVYFRADTTATSLPSIVTTYGPGWTSADIGGSGCDVIVAYRADEPKNKHPVWPGGRPHFSWVVKGKRCYDPRKDSTVGGSGSHLWADPSTWEWSENPAVCRYNWARGIFANDQVTDPSALLIGRGLSEAEAPPANIFPAANLCDEVVGSGVRYRVAGPVYANQTFIDVEQMFAIACAGSVITHEGDVQLEPGQSKSIVATITDADLLSGQRVSWNQAILSESSPEWVNTVVANYVEPTQQWASHQAPPARSVDDIIADGRPREAQITLRLVKDLGQAQRIAEILRRLGRLWGRASIMLGPRFCELEEGDWINWQSDRYFAGGTRTFRVEAYQINEKWQNSLTLREINASVFDGVFAFDSDHSVATPTTPPPAVGSPGGTQWALAAVTLSNGGASVPALEITGSASDNTAVEAIIFEYWKSDGVINPVTNPDDPTWVMEGSHEPTTTKVDITSIQGGQVYYAAVTYVVSGIPGDRRVLGPVTAASIDVSGQVQALIDASASMLDIRHYGAVSGTSGAAAATTAAIAALPTNGGTVYIPDGNWVWEANVAISRDHVTVVASAGAFITRTTANPFFSLSGSHNSIVGGKFDGAKATVTAHAALIWITGSFNLVADAELANGSDQGIGLDGQATTCQYNVIRRVYVHDVNGSACSQNKATDTTIDTPICLSVGLEGVTIDNQSHRCRVIGGFLSTCCQTGGVGALGIDYSDLWCIQGVHIDSVGSSLAGVKTQNNLGVSNYGTIAGCKIIGSAIGVWLHNGTSGASGWNVVDGCVFRSNGSAAILIDASCNSNQIGVNSYNGQTLTDNGTGNVIYPNVTATSAAKWTTARTLSFTGDVTGSGSVDGSANVATALTLAGTAVTPATYGDASHVAQFTVDAKGRLTFAQNVAISGATPPGGSSGQVQFNNAGAFGGFTVSGDATLNTATGALTIATAAVTYGKMQPSSAASVLLGRGAGSGAGALQEITLGSNLSLSGTILSASGTVSGAGGLVGVQRITATGSGTYTPTAGTTYIIIELQAAGGGGGGVASPGGTSIYIGAGGGGGAWLRKKLTANFSGASYSVGAKGTGGAAGNNNGTSGGDTTFTDTAGSPTTYTAHGGAGGGRNGPFGAPFVAGQGTGGTASGGDDNVDGGVGNPPIAVSTNNNVSGAGGYSRYSPGAASLILGGTNSSAAGGDATGKGGGGAGAVATGTGAAAKGGNGSDGVLIIWEYS